jgi:uncharacterized damage-inducible protein DinB
MNEIQGIAEEMKLIFEDDAWHGPGMRKILNGISAEVAAKRPANGGHSIWELVHHIRAWEGVFGRRILGRALTEPEEGDFPAVRESDSWESAVAALFSEHEKFQRAVSSISASLLDQIVPGKDYTYRYLFRGAIRHAVYHSGQIGVLKRELSA